jgi:hypothetical protein
MNILRFFNTLLLAGILATLILIFVGLRQPIKVREPVAVEGWSQMAHYPGTQPVPVKIERD